MEQPEVELSNIVSLIQYDTRKGLFHFFLEIYNFFISNISTLLCQDNKLRYPPSLIKRFAKTKYIPHSLILYVTRTRSLPYNQNKQNNNLPLEVNRGFFFQFVFAQLTVANMYF